MALGIQKYLEGKEFINQELAKRILNSQMKENSKDLGVFIEQT